MAQESKRAYVVLQLQDTNAPGGGIGDVWVHALDVEAARNETHALQLAAQELGVGWRVAITRRAWRPRGAEMEERVRLVDDAA